MRLLLAVSGAALCVAGGAARAEDPGSLEQRIAALEAALADMRAELAAARGHAGDSPAPVIQTATSYGGASHGAPVQTTDGHAAGHGSGHHDAPSAGDGFRIGDHLVRYGGQIKLDMIGSRFRDGDPGGGDLAHDYIYPGIIPVGGASEDAEVDFSARQTRFWLTTEGTVSGHRIGTRIEMDFQTLPGGGDQRTTNPSTLAVRRAYVTVDDWLLGQDWSTFSNYAVMPESADYYGPAPGVVFVRQPQIRYTRGSWSIALENPESTVTPYRGGTRVVPDDSAVPDLAVRWTHHGEGLDLAVAGLARRISATQGAIDGAVGGWGVSASGKIAVGRDDLRFMLTTGEGIGRYVGVNFANDAVATATGDLEAIGVTAGFVAYRHLWTDALRSTLTYAAQSVDNDRALTGLSANAAAQSIHLNLIWTPLKGLDLGAEWIAAERELESGATGDVDRLHLFAKFGF